MAQKELARLGCFSGDQDGILGPETKVAIKKYKKRKDQPVADIAVTGTFVKELGKEKLRICRTAIVERPEPRHKAAKTSAHEKRGRRSRTEELRRKKPRARQEASSRRGGHAAMIGIGF